MESRDKDILYQWFAGMPDEMLPIDFNAKVMRKVLEKVALRDKRRKYLGLFGYASGFVAMLAVCVFVFYYYNISIEFSKLELRNWAFLKPDYGLFKTQSFHFSLFIGTLALFLLIVDSTIRRKIEKNKKENDRIPFRSNYSKISYICIIRN